MLTAGSRKVSLALPSRACSHGDIPAVAPLLWAITAVAVTARVASALYQGDGIGVLPGTYDQVSYDALARRVLSGHGFTFPVQWWPATRADEPTAHWSFLYTLYLAGVYALFGYHPLAARMIQAVAAGLLLPWLSWRVGNRAFGTCAGLGAAVISAVYPYFVYYAGALMTETFYILAILWAVDLSVSSIRSVLPSTTHSRLSLEPAMKEVGVWLLLGVALGIAALMRQVILFFLPVLLGWFFWTAGWRGLRGDPGGHGGLFGPLIPGILATLLVLFLLIAPWSVRNYLVFGRLVLLNSNAGYAFFWANHPIHGTSFVAVMPSATYVDLIPPRLRALDEAALDQALLREGIGFVVADPGRYALLSLSRVRDYFQFWPSPDSGLASNLARVFSFGILLPFAFHGILLSASTWRYRATREQRTCVTLLWLFVATYSLIHLLSWALVRYRLPVDAVLVPFAALSVQEMSGWLRRRSMLTR